MLAERRKRNPRRARQHAGWITFDNIVSHECQVLDVSSKGAKLTADIDGAIGIRFRLSVALHSLVRQSCEVVWRRGRTIGIKFVS